MQNFSFYDEIVYNMVEMDNHSTMMKMSLKKVEIACMHFDGYDKKIVLLSLDEQFANM